MTGSRFEVRRATPENASTLADLHARSWRWAYRGLLPDTYLDGLSETIERRRQYWAMMLGPAEVQDHLAPAQRRHVWVAELDGEVIGFASVGQSADDDAGTGTGHVAAIYLAEEAAGRGIGRALFTCAVDDLRQQGFEQATLWVLDSNVRARRFYEAAGWVVDGAAKTEERPDLVLHQIRYRVDL